MTKRAKRSIGSLATVLFMGMLGVSSNVWAQSAAKARPQDATQVKIPAKSDESDTSVKSATSDDSRHLAVDMKPSRPFKFWIGPFELEQRSDRFDAPWKPPLPYYQRSPAALSVSFNVHLKDH